MEISKKSTDEHTQKLRERYSRMTGRRAGGKLLDEYIEMIGYERKYATKVSGGIRRKFPGKSQRGKTVTFKPSVGKALKDLWLAMDQPCG